MTLLLILDNEFILDFEDLDGSIDRFKFIVYVSTDEIIPVGIAQREKMDIYVVTEENMAVNIGNPKETFVINVNMEETFPVKIADKEKMITHITQDEKFILNVNEKISTSHRRITNPKEINL